MREVKILKPIQKLTTEIIQNYKDNPSVRSILYTRDYIKFMISQELFLFITKIINVILSAAKTRATEIHYP